jgi:hypothetical protein
MTKKNGPVRRPKARMSVRLESEILGPMQKFADDNGLPLTWVVTRTLKMGWPVFMRQDAPLLSGEPERVTA